jgi:DNA-binding response OmpR family regulator
MFDEVKDQYCAALPDKVTTLELLLKDLHEGGVDALEKIRLMAHTLHGSGSTFGYPEISAAAKRLENAEVADVEECAEQLMQAMTAAALAGKGQTHAAVLIVDDDADIANLLHAMISSRFSQYPIVFARNGAEALAMLRSRHYALIILDLLLPDMDGRHILGKIRRIAQGSPAVFVLSGVDKPAIRDACMMLGATAFIPKPFRPEDIAEAIATELRRYAPQPGLAATGSSAAPMPVKTGSKRVLLAEDDELLVAVIKHRLGREGMVVEHVDNGAAALDALTTQQYALVILDVKMPRMDGFEVLTRIRQKYEKGVLPIVMLTSMGSEKDVVRGYDLGVNDYMLKPFSPAELLAKVKSLLKLG